MGGSGIEGLPEEVRVADGAIRAAAERGAFRMEAATGGRPDRYTLRVHPDGGGTAYVARESGQRVSWFDPELADIETLDAGDILERRLARAKAGLSEDAPADAQPGLVYRGMSFEEFVSVLRTGEVRSNGCRNLSSQEGMTVWGTDARTAASYANGFAPMAFKPTFRRPAFIVAAPWPQEVRNVPGMGDNEVGVMRGIRLDELTAVWRGRVFDFDPGTIELVPHGKEHRQGSAVMPSARVVWDRIHPDGLLADLAARLGVALPRLAGDGTAPATPGPR